MTPCKPRADWADLSAEIWGCIFGRLKPEFTEGKVLSGHYSLTECVQEFYELPRVCKRFNSIIRQSPNLHTVLFVHKSIRGSDLRSMCAYIARHCSSVQKGAAECGSPYMEAPLTALLSHEDGPSKLTTVDWSANMAGGYCQLYDSVLLLVTQFTCLTACALSVNETLANEQPYSFDLGALKALPHLAWLELGNGNFASLEAAAHLTYLSLSSCNVNCGADCGFVSSLVDLYSSAAVIEDFHTHGISACCCLRKLDFADSEILAGTPAESMRTIRGEAFETPSSFARLTNLTCIEFYHPDRSGVDAQFGWLSQLPSLRCIGIDVAEMSVEFPESLSTLSNLTCLRVQGRFNKVQIKFSVEWARLVSLEMLEIVSGQVRFTQTLAQLSCLARLRKVKLLHCVGSLDAITTTQIALLADSLGARPEVTFVMRA